MIFSSQYHPKCRTVEDDYDGGKLGDTKHSYLNSDLEVYLWKFYTCLHYNSALDLFYFRWRRSARVPIMKFRDEGIRCFKDFPCLMPENAINQSYGLNLQPAHFPSR